MCALQHRSTEVLPLTPHRLGLMDTEPFEVQLWESAVRGETMTEVYVGSAHLPLLTLTGSEGMAAGLLPLVKPGSRQAPGGQLRVRVLFDSLPGTPCSLEAVAAESADPRRPRAGHVIPVHVTVEEAKHLPGRATPGKPPSAYVSYTTVDTGDVISTPVVPSNASPSWGHRRCASVCLGDAALPEVRVPPESRLLVTVGVNGAVVEESVTCPVLGMALGP